MWLVTPTQARGNQPCVTTLPSLIVMGLPSSSWVKNPPANAGDPGSIPGSGRFPGEGNGNLLQYSCLGNPTDWGACWGTAHGVARVRGDLVTKPLPPLSWLHKGLNTTEKLSMCTHTHADVCAHTHTGRRAHTHTHTHTCSHIISSLLEMIWEHFIIWDMRTLSYENIYHMRYENILSSILSSTIYSHFYNGCIVFQLYKLLNNSLGNQNLCSSQNTLKRNLEDQPLKN